MDQIFSLRIVVVEKILMKEKKVCAACMDILRKYTIE